jgi:RNA recognition motif-containing protein
VQNVEKFCTNFTNIKYEYKSNCEKTIDNYHFSGIMSVCNIGGRVFCGKRITISDKTCKVGK